jgi:hypothetical protein
MRSIVAVIIHDAGAVAHELALDEVKPFRHRRHFEFASERNNLVPPASQEPIGSGR